MSELLIVILNKLGLGKGCRVFNISNMKRYMYDVFGDSIKVDIYLSVLKWAVIKSLSLMR